MIKVFVDKVGLDIESEQAIVLLKEVQGDTVLPIWVGPAEATAIALSVQGVGTSRPLTSDLLKEVIVQLKARVERVYVSEFKEHTFFAQLVLNHAGHQLEIDCRPSDAIALALRTEAPIFVSEAVLQEAGVVAEEDDATGLVH